MTFAERRLKQDRMFARHVKKKTNSSNNGYQERRKKKAMEFKDTWRGMKVPDKYRYAFLRWDNPTQQEVELDSNAVLAVLNMVPDADKDGEWHTASQAWALGTRQTDIPNRYGFPHWAGLYRHQQEKANKLRISEKDFRDYDPNRAGRGDREWSYAQPIYVIQEVLAHQSQQTLAGRVMAYTSGIEGFWGGVVGGLVLVFIFTWVWDNICPMAPSQEALERMKLVNPYYYSPWAQHAIGQFWGSVIVFVAGFAAAMSACHRSTLRGRGR